MFLLKFAIFVLLALVFVVPVCVYLAMREKNETLQGILKNTQKDLTKKDARLLERTRLLQLHFNEVVMPAAETLIEGLVRWDKKEGGIPSGQAKKLLSLLLPFYADYDPDGSNDECAFLLKLQEELTKLVSRRWLNNNDQHFRVDLTWDSTGRAVKFMLSWTGLNNLVLVTFGF